jgi:hypothetical protein
VDYSYSTAFLQPPEETTVVAFVHPRCVCTRASITQLIRTMRAHPEAGLIVAVFTPLQQVVTGFTPLQGGAQAEWTAGEYVKTVRAALPEARIVYDRGGIQAWRFGAYTSGTMLVYDDRGKEIFRGGITDRRGGERENPGLERFAAVLAGTPEAHAASSPVFGCPLVEATGLTEPSPSQGSP